MGKLIVKQLFSIHRGHQTEKASRWSSGSSGHSSEVAIWHNSYIVENLVSVNRWLIATRSDLHKSRTVIMYLWVSAIVELYFPRLCSVSSLIWTVVFNCAQYWACFKSIHWVSKCTRLILFPSVINKCLLAFSTRKLFLNVFLKMCVLFNIHNKVHVKI